MPRRSREERELDDRLGEEGDDSNDDDQGVHRCAFCPRVFPTRVPKSIHEGRCNFRFQHFNREPLDVGDSGLDGGEGGEGDEGGDYDNDVGDFELDDDNGGKIHSRDKVAQLMRTFLCLEQQTFYQMPGVHRKKRALVMTTLQHMPQETYLILPDQ